MLESSEIVSLTTALTGAAEVDGAGNPNQGDLDGSGAAIIVLNAARSEVCFILQVADITLPAAAAHIHEAPAGQNGPVVVPLAPPDATGLAAGCVSVDLALISAIRGNPANYYVNVHTTDFPGGALRGQLASRYEHDESQERRPATRRMYLPLMMNPQ